MLTKSQKRFILWDSLKQGAGHGRLVVAARGTLAGIGPAAGAMRGVAAFTALEPVGPFQVGKVRKASLAVGENAA